MTSINLLNSGFLSMFFCTWTTGFEVVILPKFLLFLVSHVFSVVLWFKAFYKSNLASFFVWGFSDGEEKTCVYVHAGACLFVGRIMAEMLGEASVVVLWVCHWYVFVDSVLLFLNSGKLVSSHCTVSLSWENLGKGFTCPGYLIPLEKYLVGYHSAKARQ